MELNKILERDLKLACFIPIHCTGKASCSYCTSSTIAWLCPRCPALSLPVPLPLRALGMGLAWPPFRSFLTMDKEVRWRIGRKTCSLLGLPGLTLAWVLPPWVTGVEWASPAPPTLPASLPQVCLTIISAWSATWMFQMQKLTFSILNISLEHLLSNTPGWYCLTPAYFKKNLFFSFIMKFLCNGPQTQTNSTIHLLLGV